MIAALYCRVSSDSQREKQTIETQKRILADYAKRQGWQILDWYVDDGITGTSIEARPAFTRLLADAEAQRFDVLLVTDIDRLTRSDDPRQRAFIEYTLKENGIKVAVASTGELLDLDNPMHELIHSIKTWVAKEDRKKILQRMAEGRKTKTLQGKFLHVPPYGYTKSEGVLQVKGRESEVVREIFDRYTNGMNTVEISKGLTEQGCFRRKGGQWCPSRVAETIRNPLYKGEYQSKWGTVKAPSIVDEETWKCAQQRVKTNTTNSKRRTQREYLVRGLIYCGQCGSRMTAKTHNKKYSYYFCYRGHTGPYIRAEKVDAVVWKLVRDLVKDPKVLRRVIACSQPDPGMEHDIRREIVKLENKLGAKQREKSQILRLYRRSLIQEEDVEQQLREIKTAEEMILRTKELEENKLVSFSSGKKKIQDLESGLARLRDDIDQYTFPQRRELVRLHVPGDRTHRIIANPDKILTVNGVIDFQYLGERQLPPTGTDFHSGYRPVRKTAK